MQVEQKAVKLTMALTRVTIRQFETFLIIAQMGSIAAAAQRLSLTPSAVSQILSEFEKELGFRLFDRTTRKIALSNAGQDFLSSAQSVLDQVRAAEQSARDIRNRATGTVRIGVPPVLAGTALPAAIAEYARLKPNIIVRVRDTPVLKLADCLLEENLDFSIGPDRPCGNQVNRQDIFPSPWVMWCAPGHPLAQHSRIRIEDLQDIRIVAGGRDHKWDLTQMLAQYTSPLSVLSTEVFDNPTTAFGIAAEGIAVTFSPAYAAPLAHMFGLLMKHMADPEPIRHVCLYTLVHRQLAPAAEDFAAFLVEWMRQWNVMVSPHYEPDSPAR